MKRTIARLASSTTLNFASRASLAQSRPTSKPSIVSDEDMAWLLVNAVKSRLTGYERTIVFVELGSGEGYLVIERILAALISNRNVLPAAILSKLTDWVKAYTGSPEEPRLQMMLRLIRLQQLDRSRWFPGRGIDISEAPGAGIDINESDRAVSTRQSPRDAIRQVSPRQRSRTDSPSRAGTAQTGS